MGDAQRLERAKLLDTESMDEREESDGDFRRPD